MSLPFVYFVTQHDEAVESNSQAEVRPVTSAEQTLSSEPDIRAGGDRGSTPSPSSSSSLLLADDEARYKEFDRWFSASTQRFSSTPACDYRELGEELSYEARSRWGEQSAWQNRMWVPATLGEREAWVEILTDLAIAMAGNGTGKLLLALAQNIHIGLC